MSQRVSREQGRLDVETRERTITTSQMSQSQSLRALCFTTRLSTMCTECCCTAGSSAIAVDIARSAFPLCGKACAHSGTQSLLYNVLRSSACAEGLSAAKQPCSLQQMRTQVSTATRTAGSTRPRQHTQDQAMHTRHRCHVWYGADSGVCASAAMESARCRCESRRGALPHAMHAPGSVRRPRLRCV